MTEALARNVLAPVELPPQFPDHTQLPESDGSFVKNFQEHPQSLILTDPIGTTLERIHPDGQYAIGYITITSNIHKYTRHCVDIVNTIKLDAFTLADRLYANLI